MIRIGIPFIILSLSLGLCLLFLGIYDNIRDISPYDDFYFLGVVCDHWLYVIDLYIIIDLSFYFLGVVWGYGYIILVIWGFLYHRTGIYLFDFFFVCVFWDPNVCDYIIILYDYCFWDECKGFFYYPGSMMSSDLNCVCWWEM